MKTQCEVCKRSATRDGAPLAIQPIYSAGPLKGRWTCLHCYLSGHAKRETDNTASIGNLYGEQR